MNNAWTKEAVSEYHRVAARDTKASKVSCGLVRLSRRYIKGRILDVGAGKGDLALFLKKKRLNDIVAIDLVGKDKLGVIEMDSTDLRFKDRSFDTIFCTDVIEHLSDEDLESTLSEISRVSKKGAHLVMTTLYNEKLQDSRFFCPHCRRFSHAYGHQQVFDEERIRVLLNKHGLRVKKMETLHLGGYSLSPGLFRLVKATHFFRLLPEEIKKLFTRDLFVVAVKDR